MISLEIQPNDHACKYSFIFLHVLMLHISFFPLRHQHEKKLVFLVNIEIRIDIYCSSSLSGQKVSCVFMSVFLYFLKFNEGLN